MTIHHDFRKGQKVLVILRNGIRIIDKATGDASSTSLKLEGCNIPYKSIRAVTIYKEKNERG